jgi:hypothetical protein
VLLVQAAAALPRGQRGRWTLWLVALGLAPAAVIGVVSQFASFGYNVRHTAWAAVPVWVLIAHGAAHGRPRWLAWGAAGLMAVGLATANFNRVFSDAHRNEDARAAAAFLQAEEARPTFVISGYMSKALGHYLPKDWPTQPLPDVAPDQNAPALAGEQIRSSVPSRGEFWLLYTRAFHADPQGDVLRAVDVAFDVAREREFAGIVLYRGTVR